ncbi:non-heme iron oxygenase ferredoxin subunit [Rhizobium sp. WYJ-E13]|uniref:non-heme iron oxygenase ferredoxin subunit n=1 Tax=Rhizobium sp. WYJ-E13 TaxID=2849093 RepID=UPI001C1EA372|nr:non-heme iron oxygenase ferredoxin subunit [Rhizobium sp. WYJ-E13]QWW72360.1 non-heme iron oxygenase ferredoxin subunit [Rhizobium sp. WYJ-E13]
MNDLRTRLRVCSTEDVDWDSALRVEIEDLVLAVFNVNGMFYVTDDLCTHGPGSLSEGFLEGHEIECDFHNGKFDVRTGQVTAPPCMVPVKTYNVTVEGTDVMIDV